MEILQEHLYIEAIGILSKLVSGEDRRTTAKRVYEKHGHSAEILSIFQPSIEALDLLKDFSFDDRSPFFVSLDEDCTLLLGAQLCYDYLELEQESQPSSYLYQRFLKDRGAALIEAVCGEATTAEDAIRKLIQSELSKDVKFAIITLLEDGERWFQQFCGYLEKVAVIIKPILQRYQQEDHLLELLYQPEGFSLLQKRMNMKFPLADQDRFQLIPMMMSCNEAACFKEGMLRVGLLFFAVDFTQRIPFDEEQLLERMRVLCDPTKAKIIKQLRKEAAYQKQLAQLLSLSTPTIYHHMQQLVQFAFVIQKIDDKKAYYDLCVEEIAAVLAQYQQYLGLDDTEAEDAL